jgi:hypothetical protein
MVVQGTQAVGTMGRPSTPSVTAMEFRVVLTDAFGQVTESRNPIPVDDPCP